MLAAGCASDSSRGKTTAHDGRQEWLASCAGQVVTVEGTACLHWSYCRMWVVLAYVNAPLRREMFQCWPSKADRRISYAPDPVFVRRHHAKAWRTEQLKRGWQKGSWHMRLIFLYHSLPLKTTRLSVPFACMSLGCNWPFHHSCQSANCGWMQNITEHRFRLSFLHRFALWFGSSLMGWNFLEQLLRFCWVCCWKWHKLRENIHTYTYVCMYARVYVFYLTTSVANTVGCWWMKYEHRALVD
jgi:hypothetical protein